MEAVLAFEFCDRRGGGAENIDRQAVSRRGFLEPIGHFQRMGADDRFVVAAENHAGQTAVGRDVHRRAVTEFIGDEAEIVVFARPADRRLAR